jgi:hypothetical protein
MTRMPDERRASVSRLLFVLYRRGRRSERVEWLLRTDDHFGGSDGPPGPHICQVTVWATGHAADKECVVEAISTHVPSSQELAHQD